MSRASKLAESLHKSLGEKGPVKKPTDFAKKRKLKNGQNKKEIQQRIKDMTYTMADWKVKLSKAETDKQKEHAKEMVQNYKEHIADLTKKLHEENDGEYVKEEPFKKSPEEDEKEKEDKKEESYSSSDLSKVEDLITNGSKNEIQSFLNHLGSYIEDRLYSENQAKVAEFSHQFIKMTKYVVDVL